MKRIILLVLLLLFNNCGFSQKPNYVEYHKYINTAEKCFFLDNNADSCLFYYNQAFKSFDFIFVKDLVNAAQVAFFCNKPYKEYIIRGFDYGLKISHLSTIELFKPIYSNLLNDEYLKSEYSIRRKEYLKSVDFNYLLYTYKMCIEDQIDKRRSKEEYDAIKLKTIEEWKIKIKTIGFPSSKRIGIDDKMIFAEIGRPELDIDNLKVKQSTELDYFTADDDIFSSKYIMVMLVHNKYAFQELEGLFLDLISKGEIHPREVGLLYDNIYRFQERTMSSSCMVDNTKGVFYLNMFCSYDKIACSEQQSNLLRAKWSIGPLSVDRAKKEYEQLYGFKVSYGFWNCM